MDLDLQSSIKYWRNVYIRLAICVVYFSKIMFVYLYIQLHSAALSPFPAFLS